MQRASEPAKDGNWADLDRRFRAPLRTYFLRRLRDSSDAEDLTQEVFTRLTRHPDTYNGQAIEAYIFKIAHSVYTDWARHEASRARYAHHALNDVSSDLRVPPPLIEDRTPQRVLEAKDTLRGLEQVLAELSPRTREIFLLSRLERVAQHDIAALFGISVSAVEKHVIRAIAHLAARAYKP